MMVLKPIDKQKLAIRIAWMAGIFSSIVGIIMLLNYWQLKQSDPLESKLMESLVTQLAADRQNETLMEEIRNLDLMARKAYFTKQWQIRTGAYLLVGGMVILVVALRIFYSLRSKIEEPESGDIPLRTELLVTGRWVLAGIFVLFGLALFAAILSDDHLASSYAPLSQSTTAPAVEETNIIPAGTEVPEAETIVEKAVEEAPADYNSEGNISGDLTEIPAGQFAEPEEKKIPATPTATNKTANLAGNFPSFRGPLGHGIASQKNIPADWDGSENRNILWKVKVPYPGYNSPVIWGNDLYLTGADETAQVIFCYDRNTGSLKWQHEVAGIQRPAGQIRKPTDDTGYAAPTVSTDGNYVAAIFATGDVACIDMKGNRIWAKKPGDPR
jgi:outer membrane protein assembly factor BamB